MHEWKNIKQSESWGTLSQLLIFRKVMAILKEENLPNPDMAMKEDWYLDLLKDKSLSIGNSDILGEPGPGKAYYREEKVK